MSHVRAMVDVNAMGPTQILSRNAFVTKNIRVIIANLPLRMSVKRFIMIASEFLTIKARAVHLQVVYFKPDF